MFRFILVVLCVTMGMAQIHDPMTPIEARNSVKILLQSLNLPVRVTAKVCWNTDYRLKFARDFMKSHFGEPSFSLGFEPDNDAFSWSVQDEHHELIIVDTRCKRERLWAAFNSTQFKLENQYKWIFLNIDDPQAIHSDMELIMADQPVLPQSTIFYIRHSTHRIDYHQVYRTDIGEPLIHSHFGRFSNSHFRRTSMLSRLEERRNLRGKHFRSLTVMRDSTTLDNYKTYKFAGDTYAMSYMCLHEDLMQYANATMTIRNSKAYGTYNKTTGTWSYMMGAFVSRRIDLSAAPLLMNEERMWFLQYLASTHMLDAHFIFRRPTLSNTENVFLLPFDKWVWTSTMTLILLLVVLLTGVVLVETRIRSADDCRSADVLQPLFGETWMVIFGATCQQGTAVVPRHGVGRSVLALSLISLLFLFTSYGANITVLLQAPSAKIQTVRDLYESRFAMALQDNSWNVHYFAAQTTPLRRAVYNNKIMNPDGTMNIYNVEEGIRRLRAGHFAIHMEETTAYNQISRTFQEYEKCTLQSIRYTSKVPPFVGIPKNSSYAEVMKVGILRLNEYGVQNRHYRRIYAQKPDCSGNTAMFIPATLMDTMPAFVTLAWGTAGAVVALTAEVIVKRFGAIAAGFANCVARLRQKRVGFLF